MQAGLATNKLTMSNKERNAGGGRIGRGSGICQLSVVRCQLFDDWQRIASASSFLMSEQKQTKNSISFQLKSAEVLRRLKVPSIAAM